jgi:hypothetical protein
MNCVPISGGRIHSRSSDAFVDDTSLGVTSNEDMSYEDLIQRVRGSADLGTSRFPLGR